MESFGDNHNSPFDEMDNLLGSVFGEISKPVQAPLIPAPSNPFGFPRSDATLAREVFMTLFVLCRPILRLYVWLAWYTQAAWQFARKRRDSIPDLRDLTTVLNNDGLLVLDKNPELLVNSTKPWTNVLSLQTQVFYNFPEYASFNLEHLFHFMNRLDAPTSGLICLAYTPKMANLVGRAFQNRTVKKQYLAIVWGHVRDCAGRPPNYDRRAKYTFPSFESQPSACQCVGDRKYLVDLPIGNCTYVWPDGRRQKICAPAFAPDCIKPRSAQTSITVLRHGYLNNLPASFLLLQPLTGRRHQLRIHCAVGLGHPIAGDLIYARLNAIDDLYEAANYPLHRMMLHAYRLDLVLRPKPPPRKKNKHAMSEESCQSELRFDLQSSYNLLSDKQTRWIDKEVFEEL